MFNRIKTFFKKTRASINNIYKPRTGGNFSGEKMSGGMNYDSSFGIDIQSLRDKSKRTYADSIPAQGMIKRLVDTVINTGLTLESTPNSTLLNLSQEQRKAISNLIESKFNLWSGSKQCDVSLQNNLGQIERLTYKSELIKGDYFVALPFSNNPNLINPLQVKIINSDLISTPSTGDHKAKAEKRGSRILDGVEMNKFDQEAAYYIRSKKPGRFDNEWVRLPKYGPKTGRELIIHGKNQDFGIEHRGIPLLAKVAHELEKITDYTILELMAAVANATIAIYVKPGADAPATNFMPGNTFVPPNLSSNVTAATADHGYTNIGKTVLENTGGLNVSSLNAGEDLQSYDTKRPNVNFGVFVDTVLKYVSASEGMPIEILNMKFGENFSASRAALKLYWQSLAVRRDDYVSDFLTPVYNSFLLGEVGTGRLILPGFQDPILRAAWQSAQWIGTPSPSIDPFKEAKSHQIIIKEGLKTREQIAQERYRSSFDSNVERLVDENKKLADANEPLTEKKEVVAA